MFNTTRRSLLPLIQYHQRPNHAGHPSTNCQDEHDEERTAAFVDDGKGRKQDGQDYSKYRHSSLDFIVNNQFNATS